MTVPHCLGTVTTTEMPEGPSLSASAGNTAVVLLPRLLLLFGISRSRGVNEVRSENLLASFSCDAVTTLTSSALTGYRMLPALQFCTISVSPLLTLDGVVVESVHCTFSNGVVGSFHPTA